MVEKTKIGEKFKSHEK